MKIIVNFVLLWITSVFINNDVHAQSMHEIDIQQIAITDSILVAEISKMIREQEIKYRESDSSLWFQDGYGYIKLMVHSYSKGDTLLRYEITPDQSPINITENDSVFPNYFALINERPVLIYYSRSIMSSFGIEFSRKSKSKFIKMLNQVLPKPIKEIAKNDKGKVVFRIDDFRPQYVIFGLKKTIYVLRNNSYIFSKEQWY